MAHHRICPRCTSWRVEGIQTGPFRNRLLRIVNLRLYRCRDCGWQGIAKARETRRLSQVLRQPSAWKNILLSFLVLAGAYSAATILIALVEKEAPHGRADSPATAARAVSAPATAAGPVTAAPAANPAAGAAPAAAAPAAPAPVQTPRVIGNSDSKRYHLPGMKYYRLVEARHRVAFSSEAEAVKAGYRKAPR
jgi:hypothetical protein